MNLRRIPLRVGRFSPKQTVKFGAALGPVGYLAVGPVAVLFCLPGFLQKKDVVVSLFDLNKYLMERAEAARQLAES